MLVYQRVSPKCFRVSSGPKESEAAMLCPAHLRGSHGESRVHRYHGSNGHGPTILDPVDDSQNWQQYIYIYKII